MSEEFEQLRLFGGDVVVLTQGFVNERQLAAWKLSPREKDVTRCICLLMTNEEIGQRLGIAATTVKTYLETIYRKASVANRDELKHFATKPDDGAHGLRLIV